MVGLDGGIPGVDPFLGGRWDSTGVALNDASDEEKTRALVYYLEHVCATVLLKALDHDRISDITIDPIITA